MYYQEYQERGCCSSSNVNATLSRVRRLVYNKYKCIGRVCHTDREWLVNQTQTYT